MRSVLPAYSGFLVATVTLVTGLLVLSPQPVRGQPSNDEVVIPKLTEPIELDGRVQEAAWDDAISLPLVQNRPNFGAEPREKTEILIGYTENYLYAACRCYDSETPSAPSFRRDYRGSDMDWFEIIIDTFNDKENVLGFFTSPTGLRTDIAASNDAAGDEPFDHSWNTYWDAAAIQNEEGWFAEMRIPFSSLRYQDSDGRVVMGLIAVRFIARTQEVAAFPTIRPEWGARSTWKASQAQEIAFEDLETQRLLYVTPYLMGGVGQQYELNTAETAYNLQTDPAYELGLDIKYGLTSNLTLDLTVNTDFAQAEADDQEVNLTRFPLFFPEKRQFFQERSSNFAFNFGEENRLFYSRRIGLHEGHPVRILGGARVVGRAGPWDVGVLNMQTANEAEINLDGTSLPTENFSVARLRRQVLNPYSYVGGIVTSRLGREGTYNLAYGLDGIFRVAHDDYLSVKWAQTFDDSLPTRVASLDPARLQLQWERRSYSGFSYDLRYDRAGRDYAPEMGFELREDYFRLGDRISYGWVPESSSNLQRHQVSLINKAFFRNSDGSLQSTEIGPTWEFFTKGGYSVTLGAKHSIEDLRTPFALSEHVIVPEGRYSFQMGEVNVDMPPGRMIRTGAGLSAGSFYDGWIGTFQLTPTWNASRHFRMSGTYALSRAAFAEREQAFTSHIGRLRLEVTPNVRYSLEAFIQYNSDGNLIAGNIRFRYNPRDGNDLYLVFNEQLNTNRSMANPRLPLSDTRTVMLKYTYTFGW